MNLKKNIDLMTGLFFLLVTVVYASQIPLIKRTKISPVNSAFLPTIIAVGMGLLTICQFYIAFRSIREPKPDSGNGGDSGAAGSPDYRRVLLTLAAALIYVALFAPLGFVISSILYLTAEMCILAPKEARRPVFFFLISIVAVIAIYFIFHNGLSLMLPNGVLTGIL